MIQFIGFDGDKTNFSDVNRNRNRGLVVYESIWKKNTHDKKAETDELANNEIERS